MRIPAPQTDAPLVRLTAHLPDGTKITGESMAGIPWDVELPEGVSEDEVSVSAEHLSNAREVLAAETIKYAIEKEVTLEYIIPKPAPVVEDEPDDEPTDLDDSDPTEPEDPPAEDSI